APKISTNRQFSQGVHNLRFIMWLLCEFFDESSRGRLRHKIKAAVNPRVQGTIWADSAVFHRPSPAFTHRWIVDRRTPSISEISRTAILLCRILRARGRSFLRTVDFRTGRPPALPDSRCPRRERWRAILFRGASGSTKEISVTSPVMNFRYLKS